MIKIPTIKKIKVKVDPNATPQEVGDMMSRGLHMMHRFEDEMKDNPFGSKLISIGKPMMMHGLHHACNMMEPEVIGHMCHHMDHHHHGHGGHHCKHMINNIIKGIILFLIWKIFESIDNRCCGMCESACLKKFKNDLSEIYGKIEKVSNVLNESSLVLTDEHRIGMKIKGLKMIEGYLDDLKKQTKDFWNAKSTGMGGMVNARFNMFDFDRIYKFIDEEFAKTGRPEYMEIKQIIENYRNAMRASNIFAGYKMSKGLMNKFTFTK